MGRVIIVTPAFTQWVHGYSLTSVIEDQAEMLAKHGHRVVVAVGDRFTDQPPDMEYSKNIEFASIIPVLDEAVDHREYGMFYKEHPVHLDVSQDFSKALQELVQPDDVLLTHDLIYTGWNLPYFHGLKLSGIKNRCYHWIHSVPTQHFDWWNLSSLGPNHRIVIPNASYKQMTAENYCTTWENVLSIPHIRDIRTFLGFGYEAREFIDEYPSSLQADIVQVYPASSDRLTHKGVRDLIYLFREFKALDMSVCLIIANQWATGRQRKEDLQEYIDTASNNGLTPKEFIFTSEWSTPKYELGLGREFLRNLMSLSNLFVFPTFCESFGLVLPEVLLASGALPVINSHLEVMSEVLGGRGMRFGFGSFTNKLDKTHNVGWYAAVAAAIAQRMRDEESVATRSLVRQDYNMDSIYKKYYAAIVRGENDE